MEDMYGLSILWCFESNVKSFCCLNELTVIHISCDTIVCVFDLKLVLGSPVKTAIKFAQVPATVRFAEIPVTVPIMRFAIYLLDVSQNQVSNKLYDWVKLVLEINSAILLNINNFAFSFYKQTKGRLHFILPQTAYSFKIPINRSLIGNSTTLFKRPTI